MNEPNNGTDVPSEDFKDQLAYEEFKRQLETMYANLWTVPFAFTFGEPWSKQNSVLITGEGHTTFDNCTWDGVVFSSEEANIENIVGVFYD